MVNRRRNAPESPILRGRNGGREKSDEVVDVRVLGRDKVKAWEEGRVPRPSDCRPTQASADSL
ncbi:hypothetical protein BO221_47875 [Archangium sp. Cb G35]|nr:hypothetical protein BO221_47875 [Archangium sp. Cb G35]